MRRRDIRNREAEVEAIKLETPGPRFRQDQIDGGPDDLDSAKVWKVNAAIAAELEGTRYQGQIWDWSTFEKIFVEGIDGRDGKVYFPTLADLHRWSGCAYGQIRKQAASRAWQDKRRRATDGLRAMVEEATNRHIAEKIGDIRSDIDLEAARKSGREWLRSIAEPYLRRLVERLSGTLTNPDGSVASIPLPNVSDAEKILKLLLAVEGESTERVAIVSTVQVNINAQAGATVRALQEAAGRGLIEEEALPGILALVEEHVGRVKWTYREPTDLRLIEGGLG